MLRNIDEMTVPDLMEAVKRCMIYKMEISDYLDMIAIWYRDVLIYKATRSVDRVVFSDQMKIYSGAGEEELIRGGLKIFSILLEKGQKGKE